MVSKDQYLRPGFDPTKYTIPELRSALGDYSIVYPSSSKKSDLVQIFKNEIGNKREELWNEYTKSNNPNSDGIESFDLGSTSSKDNQPEMKLNPKSTPLKKVRKSSKKKLLSDDSESEVFDAETEKAARVFSKINSFQKNSTCASPSSANSDIKHFSDNKDSQTVSVPEVESSILPAKRPLLEETSQKSKKVLKRSKHREESVDVSDVDISPEPSSRKQTLKSNISPESINNKVMENFELPISIKKKSSPISAESTFNSIVEQASPNKTPKKIYMKTNAEVEAEIDKIMKKSNKRSQQTASNTTSLEKEKETPFISSQYKKKNFTALNKKELKSPFNKSKKKSDYLSALTKEIEAEVEALTPSTPSNAANKSKNVQQSLDTSLPSSLSSHLESPENQHNSEYPNIIEPSPVKGVIAKTRYKSPLLNSRKISYNDAIKSLNRNIPNSNNPSSLSSRTLSSSRKLVSFSEDLYTSGTNGSTKRILVNELNDKSIEETKGQSESSDDIYNSSFHTPATSFCDCQEVEDNSLEDEDIEESKEILRGLQNDSLYEPRIEGRSHDSYGILSRISKLFYKLILVFAVLLLFSSGLIVRQMKINAGYCDITPEGKRLELWSNFPTRLQTLIPHYQPYIDQAEDFINENIYVSCEECPDYAICYPNGRIKCNNNWLITRPWYAFYGLVPNQETCVLDPLAGEKMKFLGDFTVNLLHRRQGRELMLDELHDYLKIVKSENMSDDEFEEYWGNFVNYEMFHEPDIKIDHVSNSVSFENTIPDEYKTSTYGDRRRSKRKYLTN